MNLDKLIYGDKEIEIIIGTKIHSITNMHICTWVLGDY